MHETVKKELIEQIIRLRPTLSPKKRRVADFMMEDYKRLFLMSAKEIARKCEVSEPTITRFVTDLGFSGYADFEQYLKGLLRIELTSVERLLKADRQDEQTSTLATYYQNTLLNLENMMKSVSELELKSMARLIFDAESVMIAGYKASATLALYLGYLLKKVKAGILIDTNYAWENLDHIALQGPSTLLVVIAFPRYPQRALELVQYAKQHGCRVFCLTDNLKSPLVNLADQYLAIDMEGISFVDPFSHIMTFLGALVLEIAYIDKDATARRLSKIEDGARSRRDFFTENKDELKKADPTRIEYYENNSL
ncbi:MAG: MurR/RpiR family transcriptional regulator [Desulfobacterales bacterium]|jgi:DNA-binding MurR/RpiR family transcriptional regulator